ncbi:MAG: type III pantothenate kinase [Cytophagaceae bacterium]|nr:type III pantothenate kinase [Cytophagaceae bacterium]
MNLTIDVGNTFIKAGIFENGKLISLHTFKNEEELSAFGFQSNIKNIIISSVRKDSSFFNDYFSFADKLVFLSASTPVPLINLYKTPQSLGMDRLAAVAGAVTMFPECARLVIDAGTCITYEFIDEKDQYMGGAISPGIDMRLKALNTFTGKLPLIPRKDHAGLTGANTEESILSGVLNGIIFETEGIIKKYKEDYSDIRIIICGGDVSFFESSIKESIFAVPDLVLIGLNRILEHNVSLV